MSPEVATVLSALVVAGFSAVVGIVTLRQNRKGAKATEALEQKNTELAERTVAKEEFDSIVRELRESLNTVKADLREVEQEMETEVEARRAAERRAAEAERRAAAAERRAEDAERRGVELERRVGDLERELREARDELATAKQALRVAVHDHDDLPPSP